MLQQKHNDYVLETALWKRERKNHRYVPLIIGSDFMKLKRNNIKVKKEPEFSFQVVFSGFLQA